MGQPAGLGRKLGIPESVLVSQSIVFLVCDYDSGPCKRKRGQLRRDAR